MSKTKRRTRTKPRTFVAKKARITKVLDKSENMGICTSC